MPKKNEGNKRRVNGKNIVQEGGINMYDDDRQGGKKYSTTREGKTCSTCWDDGKINTYYNYWYGYFVVVNCTSFNIYFLFS